MRQVLRGVLLSIAAALLVVAASPEVTAKGKGKAKAKVPVCRDEKCCDKHYGGSKIKDNVSQKFYDKCLDCVKDGKPYAGDLDECGK